MFAFVFLIQHGHGNQIQGAVGHRAVDTPGFSFLGQGYDILQGNPLSTTGFGDPGHRLDIFDFSYTEGKTTNDGRYRVADGTDVDTFQTCNTEVDVNMFNSLFGYQRLIKTRFAIQGGYGPASFSFGIESTKIRKKTDNREEIYAHASAVCSAYQIAMHTGKQAPVNANFQHFVKNLPLEYDQEAYTKMIKEFGTHYINRMKVGGRWGHQMVFKSSDYAALEDDEIKVDFEIKAAVGGASKGGGGLKFDHTDKTTTNYRVTNSIDNQRTFNVGGEYREDAAEWIQTVKDSPVPVHMTLTELETLFTQEDLPMETDLEALEKKRANFKRATEEYCSYTKSHPENSGFFEDETEALPPFEVFGNCERNLGTQCGPAGEWLGKGTSLARCSSLCPNGFVHATHGDHNCKCLTGDLTSEESCDEDREWGLCTFVPKRTEEAAEAPEYDVLGECRQGYGNDCWESGDWKGRHTPIEWCKVLCPKGFVHATHGDGNCKCITRSNPRTCPLQPDLSSGQCTYVPATDVCFAPPRSIPFPKPTPVKENAVRRICIRNSGGYAMSWHLQTNGSQGSRHGSYPNPQTRCLDASVDQPKRGDKLGCRVKAIAGRTVNCEDTDLPFDARSRKQANFVCYGTTLSIWCKFDGISGLSGNSRR